MSKGVANAIGPEMAKAIRHDSMVPAAFCPVNALRARPLTCARKPFRFLMLAACIAIAALSSKSITKLIHETHRRYLALGKTLHP